jgi:tetratricopeptide (TPR) repeat protein
MRDHSFRQDREELKELLRQYENMKAGRRHSFLEEESFERIIDYFDDRNELTQAMQAAELAMEQYPYSSVLLVKKADLMIASRRYREALDLLDQAEVMDSGDINIYILKTDAYLALDLQAKAVEVLESAIIQFEDDERIELLFELADVYDDYEEFEKVFDCLKLILEADANNEEALYKICFWTDFTGRNEESIRIHQHILEEFPYNELAWFNLAAAYQGLKLYEKAIDSYQYAITIDEKFDFAYRNMADAFIRLHRYKEAIEPLEKVIELSRPEDVIYEALGHCFDKLKNYAQARFYYKKASHLNPEDSKLYYKIACTYINEGLTENAVKQLQNALRLQPLQPEFNLAMGECMVDLGRFNDGIEYFGNVIRAKSKSIKGWSALLECLMKGNLLDEAEEYAQTAFDETGSKPVFLFYKTAILFAQGKSKEALNQLEAAMEKAPKLIRKLIDLNPRLLQHQQVVDIIARYKRSKSL